MARCFWLYWIHKIINGGNIITPSYAPYSADGSKFIIECRGITPNIELENNPYNEYMDDN